MNKHLNTQGARIFGQLSDLYSLVFGKTLEHGRTRVGEILQTEHPKKILEVGVGTGLTFRHYPIGTELTGIDINEPMIAKARDRSQNFPDLKFDLQVQDATHLPYEDNSFDGVYAPSVLSVVHDAEKVFQEMIRVCKPEGLILTICYARGESKWDQMYSRIFSPMSERFLGFHLKLEEKFFAGFSQIDEISREDVNFAGPVPLSMLFVFKKKS